MVNAENSREIVDVSAVEAKMTPIELMFWRAAKEHSGDEVHLIPSPDYTINMWEVGCRTIPRGHFVVAFQVDVIAGSEIYRDAFACWEQTIWALVGEQEHYDSVETSAKRDLLVSALCFAAPDGDPAFSLGLNALHKIKRSTDRAIFTADELASFGITQDTFGKVRETLRPYIDMSVTTSGLYSLRLTAPWACGFNNHLGVS